MLKQLFPEYRYISLEDPNTRQFAESDPIAFLDTYDRYVILDEIQRVPMLFSYLQSRVDNSGVMAQYIFSGSQNFHLLRSITQTLAGRVALFKLLPLDFFELQNSALLTDDYAEAAVKGAYPAIFNREIDPAIFYGNYECVLRKYLEALITAIKAMRRLSPLFSAFLRQMC